VGKLDDGLTRCTYCPVRADDCTAQTSRIQERVQACGKDKPALGPVLVKRFDLVGDLVVPGEDAFGTPDLGVWGHRSRQEIEAARAIAGGKCLVIYDEYSQECLFVHASARRCTLHQCGLTNEAKWHRADGAQRRLRAVRLSG